jgi:molybdate transport system substrate-binding protein
MRIVIAVLWLLVACLSARAQELTVFAAASLTDALKDVDALWQQQGHSKIRFSFAASSTLARQIDQGAPANLFASADRQWMDWVQARKLIADDTRRTLLGNRLVLIMPRDQVHPVTIAKGMNLLALLGRDGRLATGDPSNVPAGMYAKQALTKLGLWDAIEPHLAPTEDVRTALLLVARGEAPLGIVYSTDAAVSQGVAVAGVFPPGLHDPITYPFAVTKPGDTPEARAFMTFLATPMAAEAFQRRGFLTE